MAPFDRPHTTFYWSATVNIAVSCTVLSYLTLNNIVTLTSGLEVKIYLQWRTNKKSYVIYRMAQFSMTLNNP